MSYADCRTTRLTWKGPLPPGRVDFCGPLRPDEAAEQQARGLKHDNTNSDIDGSQQRSRGGEWKARIDAGNYWEHGPAYGPSGNHDSPPLAEYQPHE